ncbi:protein of unknown function [Flavobacterium swingsii]|jgi:hypothetical protein|uniref:DUF349 domain-containing protein n=1 Tax=Flavobacterium swingsii TaxID=498292 RepID=A0A1I0UZE6_9FLAO|nr:DUF349 domain-containing protein [Flavobacterium swingsii]SFA69464.1 protein of unknown function [Flavobacterium swingsii]
MQEEQHDNLPVVDGNEVLESQTEVQDSKNEAIETIENLNAEVSEDATVGESHDIPMLNYEAMDMENLVLELENLVVSDKIMAVKNHIEEIKSVFLSKYNHFIEEKKEEFIHENPDSTEEFEYHFPLKSKFDSLYSNFRSKKNTHFKSLESDLKSNLQTRLALIEELKSLINPGENIKDNLKQFNDLRERWKTAGAIPKDKYNHVWNNFHFHVENFYDYLHLDREARDIDFKHNLEAKLKIITRAQELVNEADVMKAFRELQSLHKIWKEDIGPVSRENREEIWAAFSELTKQMHDKRELIFAQQRGSEVENLAKKKEIIAAIEAIATEKIAVHSGWQGQVEKIEALRASFFSAGKVPTEVNEQIWSDFKTAVRNFNVHKNSFYKDIKKDQNTNLDKKNALVARAKELQESADFNVSTPIMKKIQEEWKQIGHVPKKYSDSVWKEFKEACNHYFDRLHAEKNEHEEVEVAAFEKKKEYLETLKSFELVGEHKTDLDAIKSHIEAWKNIGKVPFARRHIEGKFNKILDVLFEKLSLSKKDTDMMRFSNRMDSLSESNDTRKIDNEKIFLIRKVEEVQNEIFQLENNIQFFAKAKKDNPMVLEVMKNIEHQKEELATWKEKLKQIRQM